MSLVNIRDLMSAAASLTAEGAAAQRPPEGRARVPIAESAAAVVPDRKWSPVVLVGMVRAIEALLLLATGLVAHRLYLAEPPTTDYWLALVGLSIAAAIVLQGLGTYSIHAFRAYFRFMTKVVGGWSLVVLCALAAVFLLKAGDHFSRVWLVSWYATGLVSLAATRLVLCGIVTAMTRAGRFDRRTAIVGGGPAAEAMIKALDAQPDSGIRIVGVFDDRSDDRSSDVVAGYPKLGRVDDLVDYARRTHLDLVVFTVPISAEERLLQMLSKLWVLPIDIRLSAQASKLRLRPRSYSYIGSVPVLDVLDRPIRDWDVVVKSLFDRVVGALLLVLLSPFLVATAIAVKLDSRGPVFFKQKRYGFNNELIEVYKFRSMYTDMADVSASKLVTKDDPRVTRVGRIIRKTSIDELPQLFNVVFFGNLSLVGPRPHALHAKAADRLYDQVVDGYFARHKVKPGITGWAQINGWRGETDTQEKIQRRVEHDLYYIEHWSVFFDLQILAMTPVALLTDRENAY